MGRLLGSRRFDVTDPANGSLLASVTDCTREDGETAVMAAEAALARWKELPGKERARLLRRWFDLLTFHPEELARLLAREEDKPLAEAKAEIASRSPMAHPLLNSLPRMRGAFMAISSPRQARATKFSY